MAGRYRTPQQAENPKVVTVRMPPALHGRLKQMAYWSEVSMNTLCVALLSGGTVPADQLPEPELAGRGRAR